LSKIAENCDHNIDPRLFNISELLSIKPITPGLPDFNCYVVPKPEKCAKQTQNGIKIFQMVIKISTFSNLRPSKNYPNWDFWFEKNHLATLKNTVI
jgi:hypothetical protein